MPEPAYCATEDCTNTTGPYAGRGRRRKYCPDCSAGAKGKARHRKHRLLCAECGITFEHSRVKTRYCSDICRDAWRAKYYADTQVVCQVCDCTFMGHASRRYCSPECRANRGAQGKREPMIGVMRRRDELAYIAAMRNDPCAYCGAPCEHLDHIEPRSLGGITHWSNLTAACARCNTTKHGIEMVHYLGRLRIEQDLTEIITQARLWSGVDLSGRHYATTVRNANGLNRIAY